MEKRILAQILLASVFSVSTPIFASSLHDDMVIMAIAYADFSKAKNNRVALKALAEMRQATLDSKRSVPHKLKGQASTSPEVKAYHASLDQLVQEIDKTTVLVKAGHLKQAKLDIKRLIELRDKGHAQFK